jgi:hypothetical protein
VISILPRAPSQLTGKVSEVSEDEEEDEQDDLAKFLFVFDDEEAGFEEADE